MPAKAEQPRRPLLMACTVGGSPRPVAISMANRRPDRVIFFASSASAASITSRAEPPAAPGERDGRGILQLCEEEFGLTLPDGSWQVILVPPQHLSGCVGAMRTALTEAWRAAGDAHPELILEITGGTKLMTAALALAGQRLPCRYAYVAAKEAAPGRPTRTKDGLGITIDGQESVLHHPNPWDALGYQTVEDAALLFDSGHYHGAWKLVERHLARCSDPALRRRLGAWGHLFEGYGLWDQFSHREARTALQPFLRESGTLAPDLGDRLEIFTGLVASHTELLVRLSRIDRRNPEPAFVTDLLATAARRAGAGRLDEAALCAYRAIEALGQIQLGKAHGIQVSKVRADVLPAALRELWCAGRPDGHPLKLGAQMAYALLEELGDPLGARFRELRLQQGGVGASPLELRNHSILAHGFEPISPRAWKELFYAALHLAELAPADLTAFPRLGLET